MNKREKVFISLLLLISATCAVTVITLFGAVPLGAPEDSIITYANATSVRRADYFVVDRDLFYQGHNVTAVIESLLGLNATNEWGLVYGTTGDWFNYTDITYTPVYLGLQMHPLNLTIGGEYVIPNVYDKDDYHWQLELVWMLNGTQCNKDCLVMYYAHVEWDNEEGLEYIEPNQGEPA